MFGITTNLRAADTQCQLLAAQPKRYQGSTSVSQSHRQEVQRALSKKMWICIFAVSEISILFRIPFNRIALRKAKIPFIPIALRKAKIVYNFSLSECNRVKLLKKNENL